MAASAVLIERSCRLSSPAQGARPLLGDQVTPRRSAAAAAHERGRRGLAASSARCARREQRDQAAGFGVGEDDGRPGDCAPGTLSLSLSLCLGLSLSLSLSLSRFLNTMSTRYLLRADRVKEAEAVVSLFTKDGDNPNNLHDMQCMWCAPESDEAGRG